MENLENKERPPQEPPDNYLKIFFSFSSVMLACFLVVYILGGTHVGEVIQINIIFNGGFILAFACLIYATFVRRSRRLAWWFCFIGAFCGLVYEGGCYAIANSAGKAMGGGGDDNQSNKIILVGACIAFIWGVIIFALRPSNDEEKPNADKDGK